MIVDRDNTEFSLHGVFPTRLRILVKNRMGTVISFMDKREVTQLISELQQSLDKMGQG